MDYEELKRAEIHHYAEVESLHPDVIPDICTYWEKCWEPITSAAGFRNDENMFLTALRDQCRRKPSQVVQVVSFGTGTCDNEIAISNALADEGISNFAFECLEFNPVLCSQVRQTLAQQGLERYISVTTQDINEWMPTRGYDVVMAAWCLHHFVTLEQLFDNIKRCLVDDGVFVTAEAMGRNGHQRWPEVWPILTPLWDNLPDKYKFNHQLQTWDIESPWDDDCAAGSFEGVRAQDILPLLIERFHFHQFAPYGNLAEKFFEKNYGPNYNANDPIDTAIIHKVAALDEALIDAQIITPCRMYAVLGTQPAVNPQFYKNWTPEYVMRDPSQKFHRPAKAVASQPTQPDVTVLMAVNNSLPFTLTTIESVRRTTPSGTQVIVVDLGSTDGTAQYLSQFCSDVEVVTVSATQQIAQAWQQGLSAAKGNTVVFLSNDVRVQEGWLEPLLQDIRPNVALSPTLVDSDGIRSASASFESLNGVCLAVARTSLESDQEIQAELCQRSVIGKVPVPIPAFTE